MFNTATSAVTNSAQCSPVSARTAKLVQDCVCMQAPAAAMIAQPSHAVTGGPSYASQALGSTDTVPPGHVTHLIEKYKRHATIKDRQVKQEAVRRQRMVEPAFHSGSMKKAPKEFAPFQVSILVISLKLY